MIELTFGHDPDISKLNDDLRKVVDEIMEGAVIRATLRATERAKEEGAGPKRTWLTDAQKRRGFKEPRGRTSKQGFVPVDEGLLKNSIRHKIKGRGANISGLVFSDIHYAAFQEGKRGFFAAAKEVAEDNLSKDFKVAVERAKARLKKDG